MLLQSDLSGRLEVLLHYGRKADPVGIEEGWQEQFPKELRATECTL